MSGIFNVDNGFFSVISKIVDMIIISIVWCLLCIPIITIGPATTALYYTVVKVIRRERSYLLREFFRSFKANFKNGAIIGVIITIVFYLLFFDRNIALNIGGTKGYIMLCIFNALLLILLCVTIYIFPILSRFNMDLKQLVKTALLMSMKHLPSTILLDVLVVFFIIATPIIPILFIITPALCCLLCSLLLERIFKKYMPAQSEESEESSKDQWYLE